MPCGDDLAEGAKRRLDTRRGSRSAFRIRIKVRLHPFVELALGKPRCFMRRYIFDEAVPLIFAAHQPPSRETRCRFVPQRRALRDGREEYPAIQQSRMRAGKLPGGHRTPRVRDY